MIKKVFPFFLCLFCLVLAMGQISCNSSVQAADEDTINDADDTSNPVAPGDEKTMTVEGVVQMWIVNAYGDDDNDPIVSEWRETDSDNEFLNFVVHTDKPINITQYVDPDEIFDDLDVCSDFTLRSYDKPMGKDFASAYANHRVKVTGTVSISQAGWRNTPPVLFEIKSITIID
ncbi:MAG: hypothetical protein J5848_06075 [Bacteroidales bacterium]|nr:hypothetical protein [Bacteroidales bacterium]